MIKDTETFILKAKEVHGEEYDYSLVDYKNSNDYIKIICKKHGFFNQRPKLHTVRKFGCPKCYGKKQYTTKEFIEKAKIIHGDEYDYSNTIYDKAYGYVEIICKNHGSFFQLAYTHLDKRGCPKCYGKINSCTEDFIKKANIVHRNIYNYSKTLYTLSKNKIIIICNIHGEFSQTANNHLNGKGCKKCHGNELLDTEEFIKIANKIHYNKYNYTKSVYKNSRNKIIIICNIHGEFSQTANNHLNGRSCPKCYSCISKQEIEWLNYLKIEEKYRHKSIIINEKQFNLDAYNENNNTIYEFYGDFWHGNLEIYNENDIHPVRKISYGKMYDETLNRENVLKQYGYNIVSIWENDWKKIKKDRNV